MMKIHISTRLNIPCHHDVSVTVRYDKTVVVVVGLAVKLVVCGPETVLKL